MSLRAFHICFILASSALAAFYSAWAFRHCALPEGLFYCFSGIFSLVSAAALVVYLIWFLRKTWKAGS